MSATLPIVAAAENDPVIHVNLTPADVLNPTSSLKDELLGAYEGMKDKQKSVVVEINSEVAGSSLIRAVRDLYLTVHANNGEFYLANYPKAYRPALNALGIPDRPGFIMTESKEEALDRLKAK